MRRFLTMYIIEQKISFRSPDVILFGLMMPVVVFGIITMIMGNKEASKDLLLFKVPMFHYQQWEYAVWLLWVFLL